VGGSSRAGSPLDAVACGEWLTLLLSRPHFFLSSSCHQKTPSSQLPSSPFVPRSKPRKRKDHHVASVKRLSKAKHCEALSCAEDRAAAKFPSLVDLLQAGSCRPGRLGRVDCQHPANATYAMLAFDLRLGRKKAQALSHALWYHPPMRCMSGPTIISWRMTLTTCTISIKAHAAIFLDCPFVTSCVRWRGVSGGQLVARDCWRLGHPSDFVGLRSLDTVMVACQRLDTQERQRFPLRWTSRICQARTSLPTKLRTYLDEYLDRLEASGGLPQRSYAAACTIAVVCVQQQWWSQPASPH